LAFDESLYLIMPYPHKKPSQCAMSLIIAQSTCHVSLRCY